MTTDALPEALRLADWLDHMRANGFEYNSVPKAAAELRRLHALNQELLEVLSMARNNIQADRDVLLECCARHDGSLEPEDAELLAVVNGKLAQIDAAIAKATGETK